MTDPTTRTTAVAYFVQSRPAPGQPWQPAANSYEHKADALRSLAYRRRQQPNWEHRPVQAVTTITVSPVDEETP